MNDNMRDQCACYNIARQRAPVGPFAEVLHPDAPGMEYSPHFDRKMRHAGQLKLLCSEIAFLNRFGKTGPCMVVYAGAAPGLHIPRLASMFPDTRFVLIDPEISALDEQEDIMPQRKKRRRSDDRIEVMRAFMSDALAADLAKRFASDRLLFISDVRVGPPPGRETDRDQQIRIQRDMDAQMGWHRILNANASLLKFRLPWNLTEQTHYLNGMICLPIFGKRLTHETRLLVERGADMMTVYDNRRYERQMAYFNRVLRVAVYDSGLCYDCTAFRRVLAAYLGNAATANRVEALCDEIEREMGARGRAWAVDARNPRATSAGGRAGAMLRSVSRGRRP